MFWSPRGRDRGQQDVWLANDMSFQEQLDNDISNDCQMMLSFLTCLFDQRPYQSAPTRHAHGRPTRVWVALGAVLSVPVALRTATARFAGRGASASASRVAKFLAMPARSRARGLRARGVARLGAEVADVVIDKSRARHHASNRHPATLHVSALRTQICGRAERPSAERAGWRCCCAGCRS